MGKYSTWIVTIIIGIACSLAASYIYAAHWWVQVIILLIAPLIYFLFLVFIGYSRLHLKMVHSTWAKSGFTADKLIRQCNSMFRFMTITGRTSIFRTEVESAILERCTVGKCRFQFLLLHPFSPYLEAFCQAEGTSAEQTREKIIAVTRNLLEIKRQHNLKLEVRWTKSYPIWRIALVDDRRVYVGFYGIGRKGYEGPLVIANNTLDSCFYYPFSTFFNYTWNESSNAADEIKLHKIEIANTRT